MNLKQKVVYTLSILTAITCLVFVFNYTNTGVSKPDTGIDLDKIHELMENIDNLMQRTEEVHDSLKQLLDMLTVKEIELTGYAPLDPQAVEGMCFQGNPNITASGQQVVIGETVAAGRDIPFGTRIWIQGHGWRIVHDRGGMITNNHLDIAVATREEAFTIGRQQIKAVFVKP